MLCLFFSNDSVLWETNWEFLTIILSFCLNSLLMNSCLFLRIRKANRATICLLYFKITAMPWDRLAWVRNQEINSRFAYRCQWLNCVGAPLWPFRVWLRRTWNHGSNPASWYWMTGAITSILNAELNSF